MTITANVISAAENTRITSISHLDIAASPVNAAYDVGFRPRYVKVENATDGILLEWYEGMLSGHAVRTLAAGARALVTTGGITLVNTDVIGFAVLQNKQYRVQVIG